MLKIFAQANLNKAKVCLLLLFIAIQMGGTLYLPTLTADIINNGVVREDLGYVLRTGAIMLGVAILTGIFSILGTYLGADVATTFAKNTRKKLFSHTQKLSCQDFRQFGTSSLITRATNDIEQLQSCLGMFFDMMIPAPFVVVIGMILAFSRDVYMALIILAVSLILIAIFCIVVKKVFPLFAKVQLGLDKINGTVAQYIAGIRVIRAFNRAELEEERMDDAFSDYARVNIRINRIVATMMPVITLFMSLSAVAIVWFGGLRINSGDMLIGDITAIIEYTMNILMYLIMAVFAAIYVPRAKVCAGRVMEVLGHQPEIADGHHRIDDDSGLRLEFIDVSFSYQGADNPVLNNIGFVCEKGTTTAIIGGTGSGKSTVARLILRLIDVSAGEIAVSGVNIKSLAQEQLRRKMGFAPQKAFLFSGTIAENIRHGNKEATMEEVRQAAITAQADDFISEMDDKYDSIVAQGGRNLSGGQRQRLSIARMLLKKPDIYVFDDSFSALDLKTDASLRMALREVTKEAIVITVAQRISTIRDADQIIVLDEGRLVGKGKHGQLMESCDVYCEIARSQLSEEELGA